MPIEDQHQENDAMQQTNQGNAKGWQTEVKGGTANIAETIIQVSLSSNAGGNSLSGKTIDFQPYLRSLIADEKYQQKWGFYTPTDAIGQLQKQKQPSTVLDIGLMVQLMQPKQAEADRNPAQQEKTERLPVLEGIRKYAPEHVLLMGRPGSGKSTALLRLLVDEARKALADPLVNIPVLVELRYLDAERPSVLERIGAFLQSHALSLKEATLKAALIEGKLLLLIDGVNELPSEPARRAVARFRHDYPKTPMIFTTRDIAIGGDVGIEKKLEMQPLNEAQMRQFVQAYLPEQGEPMLRQLQGRLREIGQTPLLLWMLCEVFRGLQQLPSSLGLLFRWFAGEYDKLKQDVPVSPGLRHWQSELLQYLAFTMMQAEEPTELRVAMPRSEAETVLAEFLRGKVDYPDQRAKEWLEDLLEHHLLQRTSQDQLEFHHQLLQEYYAAEALLRRLPHLSDEQLKEDYLNYLKWTEPIKLMQSLFAEKVQVLHLVKLALTVDLMLTVELINVSSPEWHQYARDLITILEAPQKIKNFALILTQYISNDTNPYNFLYQEDYIFEDSVKPLESLLQSLGNSDYETREHAITKLEANYSSESIEILEKFIKRESVADLRALALSNLGKVGTIKSVRLVEESLNDEDWLVRLAATQVVGAWKCDSLVPVLIAMLEDDDYDVRGGAAKALGKIRSESAVQGILDALSKADEDYLLADEFYRFQIENRFVVEALKGLKDASPNIQKTAIKRLRNIGSKTALQESIKDLQVVIESKPEQWISTVEVFAALGSHQAIEVIIDLLDGTLEDENLQLITVPEIVGRLKLSCAVPALRKLIYSSLANESIADALARLNVVSALPRLIQLWELSGGMQYRPAIAAIQNCCKFYNYEIAKTISQL